MSLTTDTQAGTLLDALTRAQELGLLRHIDLAFARFIHARADSPPVALAAALVSHALSEGHSCLDLAQVAGGPSFRSDDDSTQPPDQQNPALDEWQSVLGRCSLVGGPGDSSPLILDGTRLYLQRYWHYETDVARLLRERAGSLATQDSVRTERYFAPSEQIDWQAVAAAVALDNRVTVIAGGPGTGKTYTVLRLLALLLDQQREQQQEPLTISLAAPTGKAAVRMSESIKKGLADIADEAIRSQIPTEASTLHRLLGARPGLPNFRHDADTPLPADAVVVDECSMVDLPLMAKLLRALRPEARLILIGDPNQLAAVETGNVLAELCATAAQNIFSPAAAARIERRTGYRPPSRAEAAGAFADAVVTLEHSRRFTEDSAIGALVRVIQPRHGDAAGDPVAVIRKWDELSLESPDAGAVKEQLQKLIRREDGPFSGLLTATTPAAALEQLKKFQILAALRHGPFGVRTINRILEEEARKVQDAAGEFYPGRPIMIVQNDYRLKLYNGDIGVTHPDEQGQLCVWFQQSNGELKAFLPSQLGPHEPAYAITIHKSQGSEYEAVLMVLPETASDFLTRELVYTGVSRASQRLTIWSPEEVLREAVSRRLQRSSGLGARLAL